MKNVEITTCNFMYEDGKCLGGYHEIHKINYLQNKEHLFANIDSIIKNNLLYGCNDTVLEEVWISCDSQKIINDINKHYNGFCGNIKIYAEFKLML